MLDIATGGGHTAIAFASQSRQVIATDLTRKMLLAAQVHIRDHTVQNISFAEADAENLPFPDSTFDSITCRIAPHHFPNVERFMRESWRVLRPRVMLAIADIVMSGEAKTARYANIIDSFRDPSHHQAYSLDDWLTFFFTSGLRVIHSETFQKETDLEEWAGRIGLVGDDLTRMCVLLAQPVTELANWFQLEVVGTRVALSITEAMLVGQKASTEHTKYISANSQSGTEIG